MAGRNLVSPVTYLLPDNMEIKDLVFEEMVVLSTEIPPIAKYRSTTAYFKSIRFFCVKWPKDRRGTTAKIGVCTNAKLMRDCQDYPDDERGRTWYWNLVTKELEDSKLGPPYKRYPTGEHADVDIPELFWMILDMDRGTLSFAMRGKKKLGVAFDNLGGRMLYVTYMEKCGDGYEDESENHPGYMNRTPNSCR